MKSEATFSLIVAKQKIFKLNATAICRDKSSPNSTFDNLLKLPFSLDCHTISMAIINFAETLVVYMTSQPRPVEWDQGKLWVCLFRSIIPEEWESQLENGRWFLLQRWFNVILCSKNARPALAMNTERIAWKIDSKQLISANELRCSIPKRFSSLTACIAKGRCIRLQVAHLKYIPLIMLHSEGFNSLIITSSNHLESAATTNDSNTHHISHLNGRHSSLP